MHTAEVVRLEAWVEKRPTVSRLSWLLRLFAVLVVLLVVVDDKQHAG